MTMRLSLSTLALPLVFLPLLSGCRSRETRHNEVGSATPAEYRLCCGTECDATCSKACCEDYFENKTSTGQYRACCGKVCDASCTKACCIK
jgi:hypothetical protein